MVNTLKRLALSLLGIVICASPSFGAVKLYTQASQPATCNAGDLWIDTDGTSGERLYTCESANTWAKHVGYGTSSNPSFNSVHASGGNLAAANKQVVKAWQTGLSYTADLTAVVYGGKLYVCISTHTAGSTTEPGVGADWQTAWEEVTGAGDNLGSATAANVVALFNSGTCSGYLKSDGTCSTPTGTFSWPSSDGKLYVAKDGAWAELKDFAFYIGAASDLQVLDTGTTYTNFLNDSLAYLGDYDEKHVWSIAKVGSELAGKQAADADLTTAAGAGAASNSTYFGKDAGGTVGFHALPSGFTPSGNWKIFYSNGSATLTELAIGATGTVLKSNGVSAAPSWETDANDGGGAGTGNIVIDCGDAAATTCTASYDGGTAAD